MSYLQRDEISHPEGYNGLYSAEELKKGIIQFILKDREENGVRLLSTPDIILGLKNLFKIEFDHHSVEYVMKNMLSKEGAKQVGTKEVDLVKKKCEDQIDRDFVAPYEHIKPQYPPGYYEPGTFDYRATEAKEIAKSEFHKPDIPKNLTEDELYKLYKKLSMAFAMGANYNPDTFPEFKKNSGY